MHTDTMRSITGYGGFRSIEQNNLSMSSKCCIGNVIGVYFSGTCFILSPNRATINRVGFTSCKSLTLDPFPQICLIFVVLYPLDLLPRQSTVVILHMPVACRLSFRRGRSAFMISLGL